MAELLRAKIGRGVSWSAVDQVGQEAMRFGAWVLLSRLLTPAEFGLVALLAVFTGFVGILADFHIGYAVVQNRVLSGEFLDTAFWTNVVFGSVIFLLVWFGAPLIARFYAEPSFTALARVTAFSFIITPFGGVPGGLLLRKIDFKRIALRNIAGTVASLSTTVILAYRGAGAMSLVIGGVAGTFFTVCITWILSPWRPHCRFRIECWKVIFPYSGNLALSSSIGHWSRNFDQLLIGSLSGEHALGLYSRSMALLLMPLRKIAARVDAVMFPAFATIQQDTVRMAELYLRSTRIVALLTTPISFGTAAVAPDLIPFLFGAKWIEMIPLVQILAPLGALQSVLTMGSAIYLARGRSDLSLRVTIWSTLACSVCVFIGLQSGGVNGVAVGYALFSIAASPYIYLAGARQIGLRLSHQISNLGAVFLAASIMTTGVGALRLVLAGWDSYTRLMLCIILGAAIYWFLLHIAKVRAYMELMQVIRTFISKKKFRLLRSG